MSSRNNDDKTDREYRADRWVSIFTIVLVAGIAFSFIFWPDRNFVQLTTSLITALGVVLTLRATQIRSIEQQEREDRRHRERLRAEAQKDRVQRSITQRIDLAEKLAVAVEHLSSSDELRQAVGVQEILFQIDDWYTLIESEISGIMEEGECLEGRKYKLSQESLRHRQELFDIAYKFDTESVQVLKSRARGLKQRLKVDGPHSLSQLDFSGMIIGQPSREGEEIVELDLEGVFANGFVMANSIMQGVDLSNANLESADLQGVDFSSANLEHANLGSADLKRARLFAAKLWRANLAEAKLESVNLEKANMGCANLREAFLQWSNLRSANLQNANLELSDLWYAILEKADLQDCNLKSAGLDGANLGSANLKGANLELADLRGANLKSANLRNANLKSIELEGTSLRTAIMWGVDFETFQMETTSIPWGAFDGKNPLKGAEYNGNTTFPKDFSPEKYGMVWVGEENIES
ncbi:pentapeptide repeat-containing protein [Corynebacterium durum]|uniref:pentapeptide repeat-containing protein n=1 Tax=Corynebacterium durum TaxID=61592 RepID=UPI0028EB5727|nr:pentapeptide repeat-containing protein [Corynebacterium durum]